MAGQDGVPARVQRFVRAGHASGMAPDGGMHDKTIGDALALAPSDRPGQPVH